MDKGQVAFPLSDPFANVASLRFFGWEEDLQQSA